MKELSVRSLLIVVAVGLGSGAIGGALAGATRTPPEGAGPLLPENELKPQDWLLGAPSDTERFRRLQRQLRGFDQPMWEIGERFSRIHDALGRGNYDLALFHWWKIEQTLSNAAAKVPQRAANARAFLLDGNYELLRAEFASRNPRRAWLAFEKAKGICQACHHAEKSSFANDQPLFDLQPPQTYMQNGSQSTPQHVIENAMSTAQR